MTDRIPLAQHTKASLDALYAENDRLTAELDDYDRQVARVETERTRAVQRADEAEARLRHLQTTSEAAGNVLTRTTDERDQLANDLRYVLDYRGPAHAHEQPGVWDTSGKPCDHCARLDQARAHLASIDRAGDA